MENKEKISSLQLILMIVIARLMFGFSLAFTVSLAPRNQDGWISELICGIIVFIICLPLLILSKKFKGLSPAEYFNIILGKYIGKALGMIYVIYLIVIDILPVIFITDFMKSAVFPETPLYVLVLFMLIPGMYSVYKGIECIGRASIIFGIIIFTSIIIYFVFNLNNMNVNYFLPVMQESSVGDILLGAIHLGGRFCDGFVFFMFLPYLSNNNKQSGSKILIYIIIGFVLLNTLVFISYTAVLSPEVSKLYRFPYYVSIQQINLFDFIQRIEFLSVIGWIIIHYFKLATTLLATCYGMASVFNAKNYKIFIMPIGVIVFSIIVFTDFSKAVIYRTFIEVYAVWIISGVTLFIPLLILIIYYVKTCFKKDKLNNN